MLVLNEYEADIQSAFDFGSELIDFLNFNILSFYDKSIFWLTTILF